MKKIAYLNDVICKEEQAPSIRAKNQAVCLARMLTFALHEAKEIGATDCQVLISQGINDLRTRYRLESDDLHAPRFN